MNTPNNKRKKASLQKIETAFMELLQTKALNQISVAELCKRAGLNRSTFYANYADVFDLADSIRRRLEREVAALYGGGYLLGSDGHDYLPLFRHIREHPDLYRAYFKLGYDGDFQIVAYDRDLGRQHFQGRFLEYHMEFFRSGLNRVIQLWLQNGCRESPEDLCEILRTEYRGRREAAAAQLP